MLIAAMVERLGIIVTIAFVMTRISFFRHLIEKRTHVKKTQTLLLILLFGFFGIVGTYTGLIVNPFQAEYTKWQWHLQQNEAIANSRVIGVVVAGLLGGPWIGLGAGLVAGVHRYFLGGFTAFSCGISTVLAGLLAGWIGKREKKNRLVSPQKAFLVGFVAEGMQMLLILLLSKPFADAYILVSDIGWPMILANGVGAGIFLLIIKSVFYEEERMGAAQSQKALRLADSTVKYMRKGLNAASAQATCEILMRDVNALAVSITNTSHILAHVGLASDHHQQGRPIQTEATKRVIETGELMKVGREDIQCDRNGCPLGAAIMAPLLKGGEIVGTLKFYFHSEKEISPILMELTKGIATLLSHQLELAEIDTHKELAKESEVKALQAQINPHFLFNTINVIVSLTRINPDKARTLLISLSQFVRQNLTGSTKSTSTLKEEGQHVKAYLAIEEARFFDRLEVVYEIDEGALQAKVPSITLQPLVENAIKHGMKNVEEGFVLKISIDSNGDEVTVRVEDNGAGIDEERVEKLLLEPVESQSGTGIGLYNVNTRLEMMMGKESGLSITSSIGNGTTIEFTVRSEKG
ncbi:sensor histidine kinase [Rossellomorea aquimaris]|uniref:sensor histidine kinase n=1 Tax=Rossellomorea aquimaris TaxID=189382 RepID=UPI0011E98E4F|nr:sensor histidine kinase [Rossellomorea aquimaris]TYS90179.1 sensor histidine kinase [Rossellomorea aquimaris]